MVTPDSRPQLVSSLERANGEAFDKAMCRRISVNEVGVFVMDSMDGTVPVSRIAIGVSERFGISEKTALADTMAFVDSLKSCSLVNIRYPVGHYARTVLTAVLTLDTASLRGCRALLVAQKRVDIRGRSFASIVAQVSLQLYSRHLWLAAYLTLLCGGFVFVLLGEVVYAFLIPAVVYCVALLGMSLHESAHLYTLRRRTANRHLGYLRLAPMEMGIGYPYLRPDVNSQVAMAGPLCPTVCGSALYAVNAFYPNPFLATGALLLVVHVLNFLPLFGSDGRNLLSYAIDLRRDGDSEREGRP
jgi:hypothetical protein